MKVKGQDEAIRLTQPLIDVWESLAGDRRAKLALLQLVDQMVVCGPCECPTCSAFRDENTRQLCLSLGIAYDRPPCVDFVQETGTIFRAIRAPWRTA